MRRRAVALVLVVLVFLSGCAGGRELVEVTLVGVLGVDVAAGGVTLTAAASHPEPAVVTVAGENWENAFQALVSSGDTRLAFTHITQLVVGQTKGLGDLLLQELERRESGYGATVWLSDGTPVADLLAAAEDAPQRLCALEKNGGVEAPTMLEALTSLARTGAVTLPVLTVAEGVLTVAGYLVWEEVLTLA